MANMGVKIGDILLWRGSNLIADMLNRKSSVLVDKVHEFGYFRKVLDIKKDGRIFVSQYSSYLLMKDSPELVLDGRHGQYFTEIELVNWIKIFPRS